LLVSFPMICVLEILTSFSSGGGAVDAVGDESASTGTSKNITSDVSAL
jgi:hypothetical protein